MWSAPIRRALIVVAHPDDETFGTGSVIATLARGGVDVTVCCATRGEAGEPPPWLPPESSLAEVRERELREAGELLGVKQFIMLDYLDSGMNGSAAPGTLAAADLQTVEESVAAVIEKVSPDVVVTLDPHHGDGHRDHSVIGTATTRACTAFPQTTLYYWALSRPLLQRWFDEVARVNPTSSHLDLDHAGLGRPDAEITTVLDVRAVRPLREQAIALHASQISPYAGMPHELVDAFLDTDRLVQVHPSRP